MRKINILLYLLVFMATNTLSQLRKDFDTNTVVYIQELSAFMKKSITKENEEKVDAYIKEWTIDSVFFTAEKRKNIIKVSNLLIRERGRAFPHFFSYMNCQLLFRDLEKSEEEYSKWEEGLIFMLENNRITIDNVAGYFNTTKNLFLDKYLYYTQTISWGIDNEDYKFVVDDDVKIQFKEITLTCYANRDSIKIEKASGYYLPVSNTWKGNSGVVTWERAGLNRDEVYATLKNYSVKLNRADYEVDSALFTHTGYFDHPLLGHLVDKVMKLKGPSSALFPQFQSYQNNFNLPGIYENIDYEGGVSMQGQALLGSGTEEQPARLKMFNEDTLFMELKSKIFVFNPLKVSSGNTSMTIFISEDSIYHPDLLFSYYVDRKEVTLVRTQEYTSQSPFYNSYHKLDMNFDQITWHVGDRKLFFKAIHGSAIGNANFQSVQLFDWKIYERLRYYEEIHPVVALKNYSESINSEYFRGVNFADYRRKPYHQVQQQLMELSYHGYIFYNTTTDMVHIRPKLYEHIYASVKRVDYDVINIESTTNAPLENASLDLRTYDLVINGSPQVQVSTAQNVAISPSGGQIVMKRNRSFQFDGRIDAGLFTFHGSNFFFDYDNFGINLQNVDSAKIRVAVGYDDFGRAVLGNVQNLIEHVTGELKIDDPGNKSGAKEFAQYPIFDSRERSYVFYDDPLIQKGVYNRDNFYFELDPYVIDSLDNFNKDDMKFKGKLVSAGIFPDISESIVSLQDDMSLGFEHELPPGGLPLYGGKGRFYDEIRLSNKGLKGKGKLDYITSTSRSEEFFFFPDSVNATANEFIIKKKTSGVQFPKTSCVGNYIHWEPYNEVLYAYKRNTPFTMFNDTTTLTGDLELRPKGLTGHGKMDFRSAELTSNRFSYLADVFAADTADFYLKSLHANIFTVMTENVNARVDFKNKMGDFTANDPYTLVEFPENEYISFLDHFEWYMEKHELVMTATKTTPVGVAQIDTLEPVGPKYISIHPDQDSLSFISPMAVYNYSENIINASKVKYIKVADAKVYPFEGNVVVEVEAKMRTLKNATVIANNTTRFHTIHSARIDVFGRYDYNGSGYYDYVDENDKVQEIFFNKIYVDTGINTAASGSILIESNFTLSPDYYYQGNVFLYAKKEYLTFKGATRVVQYCDTANKNWLYFESEINPDYIYIPISINPKDINFKDIYQGLYLCNDSIHIYPSFFGKRKFHSDKYIVTADGLMYFDKAKGAFKIAHKNKLFNESLEGNFVSYDRENCVFYGDGDVSLNVEFGQIKLKTVGDVTHDSREDTTLFNLMMGLDFYFSEEAIMALALDVDSGPELDPVDMTSTRYIKGLRQWVGNDKAQNMLDDLTLYGEFQEVPEELQMTLILSDVKMFWDQRSLSYISYGPIGIGSIGSTQVNKYVKGVIQVQRKRTDDLFDIYLVVDDNIWYYFGYSRGVLQALSSSNTFMGHIRALKKKHRRLKVPKNETSYIYMFAPTQRMGQFLQRVGW